MLNGQRVAVPIIGLRDLIANKRAAGRHKDLDDVEHLLPLVQQRHEEGNRSVWEMRYAGSMPTSAIQSNLSESDYLAMERRADAKHEYFQGELFAMAGASREHNLIVLNLGSELRRALRARPHEIYTSDMFAAAGTGLSG